MKTETIIPYSEEDDKKHRTFWLESLKIRDSCVGKIILKRIQNNINVRVWI